MAKIIQAGDLRNKVDFYIAKTEDTEPVTPTQNDLGEDVQDEPTETAYDELGEDITEEPTVTEQNELGEDIQAERSVSIQNELGEDIQDGLQLYAEKIPAQILPMAGSNPDVMGGLTDTTVTHKFRIRNGAVAMRPDLVIMFAEQRYNVRYWQPVYNNSRFLEIITTMEINV